MPALSRLRIAFLGATLLSAASLAPPALAAPATQEGAQKLTDSLARYLGHTIFDKGMVTIVPKGEGYNVTIDVDSAKLGDAAKGMDVQVGPYSQMVTPQDDGTYRVVAEAQPLMLSIKGKGPEEQPFEMAESLEAMASDAVFDPRIAAFTSYKASAGKASMIIRSATQDMDASIESVTMLGDGKPNASGGNDMHVTADLGALTETITTRPAAQPPLTLVIRNDSAHEDLAITGADMGKFMEVAAALVDAGSSDKMITGQDALKAKVLAAMPGWQNITADLVMHNPSLGTPKGIVKAVSLEEKLGSTGLVKNGGYSLGFKVSGLALPDGLVPEWARSSVPSDATVDGKLTGVDLDGLVRLVVQSFDATKTPPIPDSLNMPLLAAFMAGKPHVDFSQSLTGPHLDVKGQGETSIIPGAQGHASVSVKGLDGLLAALNPATTPATQKMLLGLTFLKGLARTGPDASAVWDVDFDSIAKKVTVNGRSFGPGAH